MRTVRFGDVASRLNIHVDQDNTNLEYYVGGEHIDSREFLITKKAPIKGSTIGYQFQFGFREGDILFMTKNPHLRKCSLVEFDGLCSIATFVIHSNDENILLQKYLLLEMQTDRFWEYCEAHKSGGVNYFITWGTLSNYIFDIPDIDIQKKSADKAWAAYELKLSYRDMIKATDEMLKSQFIEMLKGKAINGTISDLVAPKIANVKKTYSHDDTIKYIDISSINAEDHSVSQVTEYSVKNAPSRAQQCVKYGDLLVSTVRPINRNIAIVDKDLDNLVASTGFCVLRPNDGMLNYLLSIVLSDDFTNAMCDKANGGVYPAVNNGDVLNYQIHIPDDDLAKRASLVRQQADKSKLIGLLWKHCHCRDVYTK